MSYQSSVAVNVRKAVTTGIITSLNHSMVIDTNNYFYERQKSYRSLSEVNADTSIPRDSDLYKALANAFPSAGSRSLPIFVGRRKPDATSITVSAANSFTYSFDIAVVNSADGSVDAAKQSISFTSDSSATADEILVGIEAAIGTAGFGSSHFATATSGDTITFTPAAGKDVIMNNYGKNLAISFSSTETAADTYAAITAVDESNFYYVTTTVRDDTFILALCSVIDATESSDYPKVFRVSSDAVSTLSAKTDPVDSNDLLGKMQAEGFSNCFGEWHDQADTIFPELSACVYYGSFFAGTQNWKFMGGCKNPVAKDPVTKTQLTTAQQGHIMDRNAAVRAKEMNVAIYKVDSSGDVAKGSGAWMDNLTISHWIRLTQKLRIFNALVNAGNGGIPLTFTAGDRNVIRERAESVLVEAVQRKMLSGFEPVSVPSTISFEDQAKRTLKDVNYTGYFAGKLNFVIVDGILTYREEV